MRSMILRLNVYPLPRLTALLAISACSLAQCLSPASATAFSGDPAHPKTPFQIEVQDVHGTRIAALDPSSLLPKAKNAALTFDHEYEPGDRLILGGPQRMAVRVDATLPECLLYIPASPQTTLTYEIPDGREEKQTGSAYAPEMFAGKSHRIELRLLDKHELGGYRNLALNPCDLPRAEDASATFFPHSVSNSVSRSLFDFEARNAIDGFTQNGHHGVWPYQSWGPQLRTDIWWKLDFGRPVELDKVRIMVRADFPHDSYWKSADIEFSDGSRVPLAIVQTAAFQDFKFSKRSVSWLRITNVVPADPTRWCSFIEVEAWGHDLL